MYYPLARVKHLCACTHVHHYIINVRVDVHDVVVAGAGYHLVIVKNDECNTDTLTTRIKTHVPTAQLQVLKPGVHNQAIAAADTRSKYNVHAPIYKSLLMSLVHIVSVTQSVMSAEVCFTLLCCVT